MLRYRVGFAAAVLLVGSLAAYRVLAQDHPDHPKKDSPAGDKAAPPAGDGMSAEMAAWAKYAAPGGHHQIMAKQAGTWTATCKFWMDPNAPPEESTGTEVSTVILGGRFLKMEYTGTMMGQPFEGFGLAGYDNMTQKHFMIWTDSCGTMAMMSEGTCTDGCKCTTLVGECPNPMDGGKTKRKSRYVTTMVSDTEMHFEMYGDGPDGKEYKCGEITYKKK